MLAQALHVAVDGAGVDCQPAGQLSSADGLAALQPTQYTENSVDSTHEVSLLSKCDILRHIVATDLYAISTKANKRPFSRTSLPTGGKVRP